MRSFSSSRYAYIGGFLWGLFEGTFFFIVPDVLTTLTGMFRLRSGLIVMAASIVGSFLGAVVMYLLVASLGDSTMVNFIDSVPEVSGQMISDVSRQLAESGPAALLNAPLQGYPYKIYSVEAAIQSISLWQFLLWSVPSRLGRLLPTTLWIGLLGIIFRKSVQRHTWIALGIYVTIWVSIYAFYWSTN
jgi:membrane protein YqaA with SNARE-associated domain